MQIITQRDIIREAPERWRAQYCSSGQWDRERVLMFFGAVTGQNRSREVVFNALQKLDLATCSAGEVDAIVGNTSWTDLKCDECGNRRCKLVIQLGEPPDYDSRTVHVCPDCLRQAADVLDFA